MPSMLVSSEEGQVVWRWRVAGAGKVSGVISIWGDVIIHIGSLLPSLTLLVIRTGQGPVCSLCPVP